MEVNSRWTKGQATGECVRGWVRAAAFAVVTCLVGVPALHAAVSVDMRRVTLVSDDVVLTFEADEPGPYHLLRRQLVNGVPVKDQLPLDPIADLFIANVTSPLTLLGEVSAAGPDESHVYQVVTDAGGCSNLGTVLRARSVDALFVSVPQRSAFRDLRSLLEGNPSKPMAQVLDPAGCVFATVRRLATGTIIGPDVYVRPEAGAALQSTRAQDAPFVLVGAAEYGSVDRTFDLAAGCLTRHHALPLAPDLGDFSDLLCGLNPAPGTCPGGFHAALDAVGSGRRLLVEGMASPAGSLPQIAGLAVDRNPFTMAPRFIGNDFTPRPWSGLLTSTSPGPPPDVVLSVTLQELAALPTCRCADTDGDGVDDCSERLQGTDPMDPTRFGQDLDGDGIGDAMDKCPLVSDPLQDDVDVDGLGDACDPCPTDAVLACPDLDADGIRDDLDECVTDDVGPEPMPLSWLFNSDYDLVPAACDNCPRHANDDQWDSDQNGIGDICEGCPPDLTATLDSDSDGTPDNCDICGNDVDEGADADMDGIGALCDCSDSDPALGEIPQLMSRLRARRGAGPADIVIDGTFDFARTGSRSILDVVAGSLDDLRADRAILRWRCVQRGAASPQVATTAIAPSEWYLARTRSACGKGRFGYPILDGQEAVPCP